MEGMFRNLADPKQEHPTGKSGHGWTRRNREAGQQGGSGQDRSGPEQRGRKTTFHVDTQSSDDSCLGFDLGSINQGNAIRIARMEEWLLVMPCCVVTFQKFVTPRKHTPRRALMARIGRALGFVFRGSGGQRHGSMRVRPRWFCWCALYGHPESGALWDAHLGAILTSLGWTRMEVHPGFWLQKLTGAIMAVYVEDLMLSAGKRDEARLWSEIEQHVKFGEPLAPNSKFLGGHPASKGAPRVVGNIGWAIRSRGTARSEACSCEVCTFP